MKVVQRLIGNGKWSPPSSSVKTVKVYLRTIEPTIIGAGGSVARSYLVSSGNEVRSMGNNTTGYIGDNTVANRSQPTVQPAPTPFTAGYGSFAVNDRHSISFARRLVGWGPGASGGVGDNATTDRSSPVLVGTSYWVAVGGYSTGIAQDGRVYAWGANTSGKYGDGTTNNASSPVLASTLPSTEFFKKVAGASASTLVLSKTNNAYIVGNNSFGSLGLGDTVSRSSYTRISRFDGRVRDIAYVTDDSSYILLDDGTLFAAGRNNVGQLGLNDTNNRSTFTAVPTAVRFSKLGVLTGGTSFYAIATNGDIWCCGDNSSGQLGLNDTVNRSTLTRITTIATALFVTGGLNHAVALAHSSDGLGAGSTTMKFFSWGNNASGQLGLNDIVNRSTPVALSLTSPEITTPGLIWDHRTIPVEFNRSYVYSAQAPSATTTFQPSFGDVALNPPVYDFEMFVEYYV